MLEGMQSDAANKLLLACQDAHNFFKEWLRDMDEEELKKHFGGLAEVRDHLDAAVEKVNEILSSSG